MIEDYIKDFESIIESESKLTIKMNLKWIKDIFFPVYSISFALNSFALKKFIQAFNFQIMMNQNA